MKRAEAVRDRAMDLALLGVESELGLDVLDVNDADGIGLARGVGLGERPPAWGRPYSTRRRRLRRGADAVNTTSRKAVSLGMYLLITIPVFGLVENSRYPLRGACASGGKP